MSAVTAVGADNFDKEVLQADKLVIVDFWAEWCGPCKMIAPMLDEIARDIGDKVKIVKVNIAEETQLTDQYGVTAVPTLLFMKNGTPRDQILGATGKKVLIDKINLHA